MIKTGAVMDDLFGAGGSKPKQDLELIRNVALGKTDKLDSHGPARVHWIAGLIHKVENVLLPDGTRSSELSRGTPEGNDWYFEDENGRCIYGHLRIRDEDIIFAQRLDQPHPFTFPATSLPSQLISRSNACEMARDDDFALKLYAALCAGTWVMAGRRWQGSWDKAARAVVEMRGLNEPYTKFLLGDIDEREVSDPDVIELMEGLGWVLERLSHDDDARMRADRTQRALNLLDSCERNAVGPTPEWFMKQIFAVRPGNPADVLTRLNWAAFSGQMTAQNYFQFWELFDIDILYGDEDED